MERDGKETRSQPGPEQSSNCSYSNRSFSEERAEWVKSIREHWFHESEEVWSRYRQFVFTFLGALTFFVIVFISSLVGGSLQSQIPLFATTLIYSGGLIISLPMFFGALLAWREKKTNPIRLYLSGVALPAFVMSIAFFPYRLGGTFL